MLYERVEGPEPTMGPLQATVICLPNSASPVLKHQILLMYLPMFLNVMFSNSEVIAVVIQSPENTTIYGSTGE